jgi:hypothetical protein
LSDIWYVLADIKVSGDILEVSFDLNGIPLRSIPPHNTEVVKKKEKKNS